MATTKSNTPRLVLRNLPFAQSKNVIAVDIPKIHSHLRGLRLYDWFHVFLRFGTLTSGLYLLGAWTIMILVFAGIYEAVDMAYPNHCGLTGDSGVHLGVYFAFSLETCTTVGYGLPGSTNAFFEDCPGIQIAIFAQMVWSMIYNAFLLAFFFARIAKSEDRGAQVIFSKQALLKLVNGKWTFSFRVADVDAAFPVVEAHVRMYAKRGTEFTPLRITDPNDDLGAVLFLSWPSEIKHEIDYFSPVYRCTPINYRVDNARLALRSADGITGGRDDFLCPICGETYGTMERLKKHVEYNLIVETNDEYPVEGTHQSIDMDTLKMPDAPTIKELQDDFPDEILVLVEGIDPLQSGTFQALQSYTMDEISWGGSFADCLSFGATSASLDLQHFHQIDTPEEAKKDE